MFIRVTGAEYCVCGPFYIQMHPSTPLRVKNKDYSMVKKEDSSMVKKEDSFMPPQDTLRWSGPWDTLRWSGDEASVYVLRIITHKGALLEGPERRKSRWPR